MNNHRLGIWIVAVVLAIAGITAWLMPRIHVEPYVIHYVNYRGHTNIDAGFEAYLNSRKIPFTIIYHDLNRNPKEFPNVIASIRADKKTDLVVTWGTTVTLGVFGPYTDRSGDYIKDIDGIFTLVTDPVHSKVVPSNISSGRNLTGSWHVAPASNQFRAMMVYKPAKKIGILYTPTETNSVIIVEDMRREAAVHDVEIIAIPFTVVDGIPNSSNATAALIAMKKLGVEWLYLPPDSFLGTQTRDLIIPEAHSLGIATFASTEQLMQTGAAFGLLCPYWELGTLAAKKAEKILRDGVEPSSLPIDTVDRFHHQMNLAAMRRLGLTVPESLVSTIETVEAP